MKTEKPTTKIEKNILTALDVYRGLILDMVEQSAGDSAEWPYLRGRLLKALGDRGLAGSIREILAINLGD